MRVILGVLLLIGLCAPDISSARKYRGQIDLSSNNVSTTYELVLTNSKETRAVSCSHSFAGSLFFSISANMSDCSDAVDDVLVGANGAFAYDDYPVEGYVCVRTASGTASSGFIQCQTWWEGVPN